jgi:hypothetical protein
LSLIGNTRHEQVLGRGKFALPSKISLLGQNFVSCTFMQAFNEDLKEFINSISWTHAKTMPEWPHEYIVRKNVDEKLFIDVVNHIRKNGYQGTFYKIPITYFDEDGLIYWTMGSPVEETIIINRCKKENSYEERLKNGNLPPSKNQ